MSSKRILLTTTSFQDTPGPHHDLLNKTGFDLDQARGPLDEGSMLGMVGEIDGIICGDDAITRNVIEKALPRLKVISKYGIGVDKIDVNAATDFGLPVLYTPGVNHTTVAEHTFMLLLALEKNLIQEVEFTRAGEWKRITGHEIMGKTIGIVGLGRIGKEVALRAKAFGMKSIGYGTYWDKEFAAEYEVKKAASLEELFTGADVITLHTKLTEKTRGIVNRESIRIMKDGVLIINCSRGKLVETEDVVAGLESGKIGGYGTDVLDQEPPPVDHPLLRTRNCIVTPHIGSRTYESVERQAMMATRNLIMVLNGEKPLAQVNSVPIEGV
ncbi:MAG: Hydroxypyruvate reductase [Candidatus Moanabacter tarae]|uniref:Hydroxypyruvate reductase n=1 Tax=Candidatus Moanibacter tarae TaxID=2200854 RepID=A0A2Z4AD55_9BACT|nr:MAG: Hydroxypyruvate reductase [Candidatus Moanabacter tarae]|tara:strand:- start:4537 stop:5517 length:981 start_codon:yes stop_codon:yes gene_type:complete